MHWRAVTGEGEGERGAGGGKGGRSETEKRGDGGGAEGTLKTRKCVQSRPEWSGRADKALPLSSVSDQAPCSAPLAEPVSLRRMRTLRTDAAQGCILSSSAEAGMRLGPCSGSRGDLSRRRRSSPDIRGTHMRPARPLGRTAWSGGPCAAGAPAESWLVCRGRPAAMICAVQQRVQLLCG
jgi:hypothetical protein